MITKRIFLLISLLISACGGEGVTVSDLNNSTPTGLRAADESILEATHLTTNSEFGHANTFVNGPFSGFSRRILTTDVSEYGCNGCQPTTRVLATVDLDRDGFDEILVANEAVRNESLTSYVDFELPLKIYRHDGRKYNGFTDNVKRIHPREAVTVDFNNDGIMDIFVSAHGLDQGSFDGEQNVLILSNKSGNHYDASATHLPKLVDFSHGAAAGDIDSDGDVDLFVVVNGSGGKESVDNYFLINDGNGKMSFSPSSRHIGSRKLQKSKSNFHTARFADMDEDGNVDLIMAGNGKARTGSILVYGNGDGTFTNQYQLPEPSHARYTNTYDIDVIDLNSDGLNDLLLSMSGVADSMGMAVQAVVQTENRKFEDQSEQRLWSQTSVTDNEIFFPENLALADLDRDGDKDIVVQSWNPLGKKYKTGIVTQIALNDGQGIFQPVTHNWLVRHGRNWRGVVPIKLNNKYGIIGLDLNRKTYNGSELTVGANISIYSD